MFVERLKPFDHVLSESLECTAANTSQNLHELVCQLERRCFEVQTLSRSVGEHETKVNVNEMAFVIKNDVCIVSVFDLQNVAN